MSVRIWAWLAAFAFLGGLAGDTVRHFATRATEAAAQSPQLTTPRQRPRSPDSAPPTSDPARGTPSTPGTPAPVVPAPVLPAPVTPSLSDPTRPDMRRVPEWSADSTRGAAGGAAEVRVDQLSLIPAEADSQSGSGDELLTPEERVNIAVYEKSNRSVVNITTKSMRMERLWLLPVPAEGAGSGSVLDAEGHILTNFHVIEGAQTVNVTLFNGESHEARLVGHDAENDIAVLQIDAPSTDLFPIDTSGSSALKVGQKVYAIGNPFGLDRTLTTGIVSSLNRSLPSRGQRTMKSIIQIDAALNRGNSGGPLLNSRGQLIGMNTAIASSTGENTGVGFAIPVPTILRVVPQIIEHGRVIRPDVGISHALPSEEGLVVAAVTQGGPGEQAGLRGFRLVRQQQSRGLFVYERTYVDRSAADVILAVDGQKVSTMDELLSVVEQRQPGDVVTLTIVRDQQQQQLQLRLGVDQ
ncbi:MAG: trypsin-like peptidase domain-containing protein [Pirellulales bacterium]